MEAGAVRNADEWFRLMVETGLAPGLRALGLSGKGRRFRVLGDGQIGEVAILQTSTPLTTRFTLTLSVNSTDEWSSQLRIRPYLRAAGHTAGAWQERIGQNVTRVIAGLNAMYRPFSWNTTRVVGELNAAA